MFSRTRDTQPGQFEEWIRARSHAIWEQEGRSDGRAAEHWARAEKEIEAEWKATMEGEPTQFVPPRPQVSERPIKRAAAKASAKRSKRSVAA